MIGRICKETGISGRTEYIRTGVAVGEVGMDLYWDKTY